MSSSNRQAVMVYMHKEIVASIDAIMAPPPSHYARKYSRSEAVYLLVQEALQVRVDALRKEAANESQG